MAQREAFNVLRQHGLVGAGSGRLRPPAETQTGESTPAGAKPLSAEEVRELAETCVAMLEVHGQAVEVTLAGLSADAGGTLLPEDARKVRELAASIAGGGPTG